MINGHRNTLRTRAGSYARRVESELEYLRIYHHDVKSKSPEFVKWARFINQVTSGKRAKKYRGGEAAKAKASSTRLFNTYFKPLPQ